jgi:metallo-beta-lactamase family protein
MNARLRFHGAAHGVTGSCFALETDQARVLIDCGMFQGSKSEKELNYRAFPFRPTAIDAVLLTHAHIDHSGLIPKLVRDGFDGPIYATRATVDLCSAMLPDSGQIQEIEVQQLNRRNARRARTPVEPIYTVEDATACLTQFRPVPYETWFEVATGIRARCWNAGHLLGSASLEIEIDAGDGDTRPTRILFSGDVGPDYKLLQPNPRAPSDFDYVICESTYGATDRQDASAERRRRLLRDEVLAAAQPGGVLLIPSFAVERTQELLVDLFGLMESGKIPRCPIYIDSPLAMRASAVFQAHARELDEGDALKRALGSRSVRFTESIEQSKALDRLRDFAIVIGASGMCEAGRIRHHLRAWLWRENATVLLVGFQAQGTLGRILQDGAASVRIQGEDITVRARIRSLELYSGHADGPELVAWLRQRLPIRRAVFLVHGEEPAITGLTSRLSAIAPADQVIAPRLDDAFELTAAGARPIETDRPRRLAPEQVARLDWHNDLSKLLLDINDAVRQAADERARGLVIRRLRRALDETDA